MRRGWPVLLLVPIGMVAGHQVAYAALHARVSSGVAVGHAHGHLEPLTALALPVAMAGAWWLACRTTRDQLRATLVTLAGAQVLAFAAMETAEGLAAGGDVAGLARSPLLWVGLAVQVAAAGAVGLTLIGAGRAGIVVLWRITTVMAPAPDAAPAPRAPAHQAPRPLAVTRWLLQRDPPHLLAP